MSDPQTEPDLFTAYDRAVERLLASVARDNKTRCGLLSRDTVRLADETDLARSRLLAWIAEHEHN